MTEKKLGWGGKEGKEVLLLKPPHWQIHGFSSH